MKIRTIYDILNEISPFELQESWDNSGLNLGDFGDEVKKIYISIDIDEELIEKMDENSLLITHHPLIFKPVKKVIPDRFSTKLLLKMAKKNISHIAMHTNFDKTHLNEYVAKNVLGFEGEAQDFVFYADVDMDFYELVEYVKQKLNMDNIKAVLAKDKIKKVAVTTGSGMGLLDNIKADCFLTGDIKYHEAMDAKVRGISLIDMTHYTSEKYFSDILFDILDEKIDVEITKRNSLDPFILI